MKQFCFDCHSGDVIEAELDLSKFNSLADIQLEIKPWIRISEMLDSRQMPPKESDQPTDQQRTLLQKWTKSLLEYEARKYAGDPGPVVLRRLNNSEYNYTIQDLTGIGSLDPTQEFPVDGAAGEGFINTGDALSISPNLIRKYLDAGKSVAEHAVFTPTGIRWSENTTRRNVVDEMMEQIRNFYRRANRTTKDIALDLQGNLDVRRYLDAIANDREALLKKTQTIEETSAKYEINPVYLAKLWALHQNPDGQQHLLKYISQRLRLLKPEDAQQFSVELNAWRAMLWKFNLVGHIGRPAAPSQWQAPINPLLPVIELEKQFPENLNQDVTIYLGASSAGDGNENDYVLWKNARLEKEGEPPIYLANIEGVFQRYAEIQRNLLADTSKYLTAVDEASKLPAPIDIKALAEKHDLNIPSLEKWLELMNVKATTEVEVQGLILSQVKNVAGYAAVNGWGSDLPNLTANHSDDLLKIPGDIPPHGITVHPTPDMYIAVLWKAPEDVRVSLTSLVADAHSNCGNGTEFWLQHRAGEKIQELWHGTAGLTETKQFPAKEISIRKGEVIGLYIGPRNGEHACDLTRIDLTLKELGGKQREWDLAKDCADDILSANPHGDRLGNPNIWHITKGLVKELNKTTVKISSLPIGTILETWATESNSEKRKLLAGEIQKIAVSPIPQDAQSSAGRIYQALTALADSVAPGDLQDEVETDKRFGVHPVSGDVSKLDLISKAPSVVAIKVPADFARGRTLKVSGLADPNHGRDTTVQLHLNGDDSVHERLLVTMPILSPSGNARHDRMVSVLNDFRELFPSALAYVRLVPVDEVVPLVLWYREDEYMSKLMLTATETAALDALWDEFLFVAREPLKYEVSYEQLYQFATQDRPDIAEDLKPIEAHVKANSETFRKRLVETEAVHLNAVTEFAHNAWRRDLTPDDRAEIHQLYSSLREVGLNHEPACRLTLARILTSPNFLFKQENAQQGMEATAINSNEVASRLSYFLWSSQPDKILRESARQDHLVTAEHVREQAHRMLYDPRTSRMAAEFAAQWLHVRNFGSNNDKNEELFPEFAELREHMYQETLLFFADLLRNNGSVLNILDADYTFLNETLAKHYGIEGVTGSEWRRVDNVKQAGRGGILGMSTTLATNSGASRTSPILRGNWVYETLLGERLPKPPADVPQLPELVPEGKTARELIELHSSVAGCAKCHALIDPYGFALEQYDVLGRLRPNKIDTGTILVDQTKIDGIDGLRDYLINSRQDDFLHQFCKKLLGYSLGREVQLSDKPLIDTMIKQLKENDYRIKSAITQIVISKQFRYIRGRDFTAQQ